LWKRNRDVERQGTRKPLGGVGGGGGGGGVGGGGGWGGGGGKEFPPQTHVLHCGADENKVVMTENIRKKGLKKRHAPGECCDR